MSISAALALAKKYSNGGAVDLNPSPAQREAGNYKKRHIEFQGIPITIENPKGTIRSGTNSNGKMWANRMAADYGYIKRTEGKDGDQVDAFVGPNKRSNKVFIIDQLHHSIVRFDEHKCLLGFNTEKQALTAYHSSYGRKYGAHHTVGAVTEMSIDAFKEWLKGGGGKKPISPEVPQYQTGGGVKYTEPTPEDPTRYPYYESEPGPGDAPPQPIAPQPEQPPVPLMNVPGVGPVPTFVPETVKAIGAGLLEYGETPGELMKGPEKVEPRVEGQWDETDEYRQQLANAMWHKKVTDFAGETGINLFGTSAPFVQPGTLGVAGGKLFKEAQPKKYEFKGDPFKAKPTPVEGFELDPAEVKASKQITGTLGTSEGGTFTGFSDDINRYIKEAKSLDHAREEVLAAKLYELAGVPVAKMQVTALKGKPAISSHIISGAQQLSEFKPHQYSYIKGIQEHHAADAWLANWDWGGFGPENYLGNILVDAQGNAHRIDFGGALSRRGLGTSKGDLFTDTVGELQTLKQKQPSLLKDVTLDPSNPTANRIAGITDKQISDLVYQSKITNPEKMIKKLIARRDDLAKQYGIGKPEKPHIVGGTEWKPPPEDPALEKFADEFFDEELGTHGEYSLENQKADTGQLLTNHQYGDGTFDAEGIANDIYSMALKDPEYADGVAEKLKKATPTLHDAVQESLSQIIKKEGDPWAKQAPASPAIKLMQLNKTHSLDQIVNTVKNYDSQEVEMGKMITQKQSDKITQMLDSPPDKLYWIFKNLNDEEKINLKSWLNPKTQNALVSFVKNLEKPKNIPSIENVNASHSLEQIVHAIKNYDKTQIEVPYEVYDSVPKILDGYSAQAIVKATKDLSLGEQTKFDKWLTPQQLEVVDNFKHSQSLEASNVAFISQKYYDLLKDGAFNWSTYRPKKSISDLSMTMDPKLLAKAEKLGFNPYADVWKGGKKYPTPSGYPEEIFDPAKKDPTKYTYAGERGWFAAPREMGAAEYGTPSLYIARAPKATMVDWAEATGGDHSYFGNSIHLKRLINAGHEMGLDLIVVKNIHDVEGFGDQYVFLNTAALRAPNAEFNPKRLHLRKPLAGLAGGGIFAYGTLRGQEGEKFARGGSIKSTKDESNYRLGTRKENCAICTMFRPPNSCTAVQGKIRPQDTCDYFELSKRKNPMPLKKGSSQSTISSNIREFHTGDTYARTKAKFGKAKADKQAIAVAMSTARKYRKKKQKGGGVDMEKMLTIGASRNLQREGFIHSPIPGRTDKLPMNVPAKSYIVPADIVSGIGQGNSLAGKDILDAQFSKGPYGMNPMRGGRGRGYPSMRMSRGRPFRQEGGEIEGAEGEHEPVPIVAAGGEYVIYPESVAEAGNGDYEAGWKVLDKYVLKHRKNNIKTQQKLKPPKK